MQTYFFLGTYSSGALSDARSDRTDQTVGIIEEHDGNIVAIYALLGNYDLAIIANLPGNVEAMQASMALRRATGIRFTTRPAVSVERFDALLGGEALEGAFPEFKLPAPERLPPGSELN